jgi:pimeloyl-ACP methyl ester carboxylesterase
MEDLEAVIDRTVNERFALLGISQGAAVTMAYAVKHRSSSARESPSPMMGSL